MPLQQRATIYGTEAHPCPNHGWENIGVLTGTCLVCLQEMERKLWARALDEFAHRIRTPAA